MKDMKKNKSIILSLLVVGISLGPLGAEAQETQPVTGTYYNTRGGDSYQTAVLPPLGQDLKLNHHQRRGQYDYFLLDLKAGQTLTASLSLGEKGIEIRPEGTAFETGYPYAGLIAYDAGGNPLGSLDFAGAEKNLRKTLEIDASTPQRIYLLIGSGAGAMHKDYVGIRMDLQNNFDADGEGEAGSTLETALKVDAPEFRKAYETNHLTRNDEADFFRIPTKPGEGLAVEITPKNPKTRIVAALYDELRVELTRERSATAGAPVKLSAKANTSATFLKISRELGDEPTEYSLRFVPPPPETRPVVETRPAVPEAIPSVLPTKLADELKKDERLKDRINKKSTTAKKTPPWWKSPKMLTWGGATAAGVLALLLGGLILLRRSKKKGSDS